MMAEAVYILCAITSLTCAALLFRGYRASKARLLMWSSVCFLMLGFNNVLLFVDMTVFPERDLSIWRTMFAAVGIGVLLVGLIWDAD